LIALIAKARVFAKSKRSAIDRQTRSLA